MAAQPHYQDQHQLLGADEGAFVTQPGRPVSFLTGQFEGRTIRVELEELQKAESGRKLVHLFSGSRPTMLTCHGLGMPE